jgi:hypothetical protein
MNNKYSEDEDALIVEEMQAFLQEKRTALKTIRIGIGVIVAQISLIGFLFAVFRSHADRPGAGLDGYTDYPWCDPSGGRYLSFYHSNHPHPSHEPEDIEIQTKTQRKRRRSEMVNLIN